MTFRTMAEWKELSTAAPDAVPATKHLLEMQQVSIATEAVIREYIRLRYKKHDRQPYVIRFDKETRNYVCHAMTSHRAIFAAEFIDELKEGRIGQRIACELGVKGTPDEEMLATLEQLNVEMDVALKKGADPEVIGWARVVRQAVFRAERRAANV